jgi:phosphatidylglycerophosphatase A
VLFRIIDIWKPLGCRWGDQNIHGGWGCMLDDVLAGFYALILTLLIRYFGIVEIVHDYFFN